MEEPVGLPFSERSGRVCYGLELERWYCDVAVARWEAFTGQTARQSEPA
jgi:DNA modification methylase